MLDVDEDSWPFSDDPSRRLKLPASLLRRQQLVASEYGVVDPGRTVNDPNSVTDIAVGSWHLPELRPSVNLVV